MDRIIFRTMKQDGRSCYSKP